MSGVVSKRTHLTEQEKTAAALIVLFAWIHYDEERDGWWYMHAVNMSHSPRSSDLGGCVWWAMRGAGEVDFHESEPHSFVSYLEHVCRNRRVLAR